MLYGHLYYMLVDPEDNKELTLEDRLNIFATKSHNYDLDSPTGSVSPTYEPVPRLVKQG